MGIAEITLPLTPPGVTGIGLGSTPATETGQNTTFAKLLGALGQTQNESDVLMQKLVAGEEVDLHQVMIAADQTDIAFRIATSMRDKFVEAYREVTRMAI